MALQCVQRDHCERLLVRRCEHDRYGNTRLESFPPSGNADAPAVARLESWKAEFRDGGNEVIATLKREGQKFFGYLHAYDVQPNVVGAGVAATVAVKPGAG